jgi:hypothetical protein
MPLASDRFVGAEDNSAGRFRQSLFEQVLFPLFERCQFFQNGYLQSARFWL